MGVEERVALLEQAMAADLEQITVLSENIEMLNTIVATIIDDTRPDDPAKADEWFDHLRHIALRNVQMRAAMSIEAVQRNHGADPELLAAVERNRSRVADQIVNFLGALKRPQGRVD